MEQLEAQVKAWLAARARWVKPLVLLLVLAVLFLIPLRIISYGYMPVDDALRHAAKVVSDRDWADIVVCREQFSLDTHPGWHAILGCVHRVIGGEADVLVVVAVVGLFWLFAFTPTLFLARPEAWALALLAISVANASMMQRWFFGRPYLVPMTMLLAFSFLWRKLAQPRLAWRYAVAFAALAALCAWIHTASWYLLSLPVAALLLAREWRAAARLATVFGIGILIGVTLTGHPLAFMIQNLRHASEAFGRHQLTRMLVAEFQPCEGDLGLVILTLLLLLWRRARGEWRRQVWDNPVFFLAIIGWLLGFKVIRFWSDWGMPALAAWMALELQDAIGRRIPRCHWGRVVLTVAAVGGLFLLMTQDAKGRWTNALTKEPLSAANPEHQEWLPEPGGILYSDSMQIFYDTFLENPYGQWRYMLGFEPTWMPVDDLAVLHKIQWNMGAFKAYDGWVKKMRPQDRLIIQTDPGNQPKIKELEWHYTATNIWVGRLPRPADAPKVTAPVAP